jgi:hypothetical protein
MRRFNDDHADHADQPPEDLGAWLAEGMGRVEAMTWRRWNFTIADARQWRKAGVEDGLTAAQWQVAGVEPLTVGNWMAARISANDAVRWHEFGIDLARAREHIKAGRGPVEAFAENKQFNTASMSTSMSGGGPRSAAVHHFLNSGVPHQVMSTYLHMQWSDQEALAWAKLGIHAWDARAWQTIGLDPPEAVELHKADVKPMQVIQDWWRSGIPFDEVADWLGAGLTPAEAVEQRGSGVTVEQAAALRALRRGGAL